jgi:hypothetical protein
MTQPRRHMREMDIYHNLLIYLFIYLFAYLLFNKAIIICNHIIKSLRFERCAKYEAELPATRERRSGLQVFTKLKLRHQRHAMPSLPS